MPKCIDILKSLKMQGRGGFRKPPPNSFAPMRRPPQRSPYPEGLVIGVCGIGKPKAYLLAQNHLDELPAVVSATFYAAPPLIKLLKEKQPYYFFKEFGNRFEEFKGEFRETLHYGYADQTNNRAKLTPAKSYCYILAHDWLTEVLGTLIRYDYGYIDESVEANQMLVEFRARELTPLYRWQSRCHVNTGYTITARDLLDGYLLDNRDPPRRARGINVVGKRVPSLHDVKSNPEKFKTNPYLKYLIGSAAAWQEL